MKRTAKITILILIIGLVIFINREQITGMTFLEPQGPEEKEILSETLYAPPEIYFCPEENCLSELNAWIDAADEYVHCAFFEAALPELLSKLAEKQKTIDVKLITDDNYADEAYGIDNLKADNRSALMHNKFCILDGKAVWTGSFNPTARGNYKNNNNALFYQSQLLALHFESEFQEMWGGTFGGGALSTRNTFNIDGKLIEAYFCPEDWCANKVIYALQDAEQTINFMTFSFTHDGIGSVLLDKHDSGVKVRGVFEKSQNNKYTEYSILKDAGVDVHWDGNPANMHNKVFVIDNKTVVTGSFNPSKNADMKNDENLLIIHDPELAQEYTLEFERVWADSKKEN